MDSRAWCVCLLIMLAAGCGRVGGPCEYETVLGTAELIRQSDGAIEGRFSPAGPVAPTGRMQPLSDLLFPVYAGDGDISTGPPYPAKLSLITKGTCTPFQLTLLSSDTTCQWIFLPMNENGWATGTETHAQVAELFKRLLPAWPDLVVTLEGRMAENETDTAPHRVFGYVEKVAGRLAEEGVLPDRIRMQSDSSPIYPAGLGIEGESGVWISFRLTGQSTSPAEDVRP